MGLEVLGFLDSEFIPWPDDFRDKDRFPTEEEQSMAAEKQTNLLDYTGGARLWFPSQELLPEAWNRSAGPSTGWSPVADDPRVEDVHGAMFVPSVLLQDRLPAALRRANENLREDERDRTAEMLKRIVDLARAVEEQGRRLLLYLSP